MSGVRTLSPTPFPVVCCCRPAPSAWAPPRSPSPAQTGLAPGSATLALPGSHDEPALAGAFPQKGSMTLQRARAPLSGTPVAVYAEGVFTPVDRFYARWHWAEIPTSLDPHKFEMTLSGHAGRGRKFTVFDLMRKFRHVELVAVNRCSGNSRGCFVPRLAGGEWGNGAMGNARWVGAPLKDVLEACAVKAGALQVQCEGADRPVVAGTPNLKKSIAVDLARDGEVMITWQMNDQALLLNGLPMRPAVPGWCATDRTKMLQHVRVLTETDTGFWMHPAHEIPDNWPGEHDAGRADQDRQLAGARRAGCRRSAHATMRAHGRAPRPHRHRDPL